MGAGIDSQCESVVLILILWLFHHKIALPLYNIVLFQHLFPSKVNQTVSLKHIIFP